MNCPFLVEKFIDFNLIQYYRRNLNQTPLQRNDMAAIPKTWIGLIFRFYHQKLTSLHKEMLNLSDRSVSMKARAAKLLDAKQDEALK